MDAFRASGKPETETGILDFLLADTDGCTSLAYSLRMARENIRNTRDLLPTEAWENVNELYQDTRRSLAPAASGEDRFEVLAECIGECQKISGILTGTVSHHSPYHFLSLGRNIERACGPTC